MVDANTINTPTGKSLLEKVQQTGQPPKEIVEAEGLAQVSDTGAIREIAERVVAENPDNVAKYKSGKGSLIGWFVGQVMRESRGKADPNLAREVLEELLKQ
jgi:aspartyl-tRNA(Asn)/glutamyl-tRNA(Gln) amidotransferase subunit B